MKRLTVILIVLLAVSCYSQNSKLRIFNSNEIQFYGFDFSHFKLAEAKRIHNGNQVRDYIFPWIGYIDTKYPYSEMSKKMGMNVIPNFEMTNSINLNVDSKDIVSIQEHKISYDTIEKVINNYELIENTGIGFVAIVECFYKATETASVHYIFFDIATREIIDNYRFTSKKAGSFGLTSFWGYNLYINLKKYIKTYYLVEKKKYI
ncbi:MAG TPA: hypothetical protein DCG75_10915 [Bacteroidales bacterium]|nr:hypothetical protein [Bacteroidales bacterium]